jgi:branched-chain amino acid transport system permease protein
VFIPLLLILLMQFRPEGLMGNRELPEVWAKLKRSIKGAKGNGIPSGNK